MCMHMHAASLHAHLSLFSLIEIINMNLEIINIMLNQRMNGVETVAYEIIGDWEYL